MPFLNDLKVREWEDGCWELLEPLRYKTRDDELIVVPAGFVTDFASVPRLPLAFLLAGDTAHKSATIHDYLYSKEVASHGKFSRRDADRILREAMEDEDVWWWRRWLMWCGVRLFGFPNFKKVSEDD